MSPFDVLERLGDQYGALPAPKPSTELLRRMNVGNVGIVGSEDGTDAGAIVVQYAPRPRTRTRHLVAATVATLLVGSGLAGAGALPAALQRQVAAVVAHVGIDLPTPDETAPTPSRDSQDRSKAPGPQEGRGPIGDQADPTLGDVVVPTTGAEGPGVLGELGAPNLASPTLPSDGAPTAPPQLTLPPPAIPELGVPSFPLPPLELPLLELPPLEFPPLPLPLELPGF
jgi:hypothetical protein